MSGEESVKEEEWPVTAPSVSGARLVDAPILFFVATHKAFRAELASIYRAAAEAAASGSAACREIVVDLDRRLEFLRLVYNYHSAAEDEKRLLKLVQHVKEKDCGESSVVTGMTESQKFWSDEQVLCLCDQIEANHKRMQELTSIPGPSFELLTPEPRYKMDAETKAAIEEMYRSEEEVAGIPRADRRSLRAKYCATLLLSDVNGMKNRLERDVLEFSNSRK
ncbi:hypothetical protein CASFOL_014057 [Castilleja foliolosa]|uniref:Hemerythrin-like domain-containing protein n=1 Tax=Castilleja foliolosa TaxID=1961234 RepID=A0ABD3DME8_9LAMI